MKKQKVLIVHNYYQIPGGEDTVVENEKNLLIKNNHDVFLYTRHNDEIEKRGILGKLILPFETIFSFKTYNEVKRLIKEKHIDIIHVHNTLPLVSPSVYYAAITCRVPVIQTIHNFRLLCTGATFTRNNKICEDCLEKGIMNSIKHKCYRNSISHTFLSALILKIHRLIGTYKKIDGYIALTEFNKNKLSNLVERNKIFVKPNFIANNEKNILYKDRKNFLFLGRLDKLKGIDMLVDVWEKIENSKLIIAGKGPLENIIQNKIEINNIKNIEYVGFKSKNEVRKLILSSRAIIVPSQWYEGFPMTIVEAFSLGVPVIASDIGNLSSIVIKNENGLLFKYDNKADLADKINILKDDDDLTEKLSIGAINTFNRKYDEDINYKQLNEIYEECSRRKK